MCSENCCGTGPTVVPYQLCPKCNGDGTVFVNNWNGSLTAFSSGLQTCDLCHGTKVIPMHVVHNMANIQKG